MIIDFIMIYLRRIACIVTGFLIVISLNQFFNTEKLFSQLIDKQNPYRRFQIGLIGNFGLDYQTSDFGKLPGIPNCCPRFTIGRGWNIIGGIFGEFPFNNEYFGLLHFGISHNSNNLNSKEIFIYNVDGIPHSGEFQHILKTRFTTAFADFLFGIHPFSTSYIYFGLRGGSHLSKKFDQWEEMISPEFGTFENGRRTRNEFYNIEIPNTQSLQVSAVAGFGFEIPLNQKRTVRFAPEIILTAPFNPDIKNYNWWNFTFNAGFALKFSRYTVYPLSVDIASIDTFKIEHISLCSKNIIKFDTPEIIFSPTISSTAGIKAWNFKITNKNILLYNLNGLGDSIPLLSYSSIIDSVRLLQVNDDLDYELSVTDFDGKTETKENNIKIKHIYKGTTFNSEVFGVDSTGKLTKNESLEIEESLSTVVKPILNCIFFDEGNSTIPSKYHFLTAKEALTFQTDDINRRSPITGYYDILNILGKRLVDHPDTKILIEGCNSGKSRERNDTTLALNRAAAVRDYFLRVWGIQSQRLILSCNRKAGGAPRHPSFPHDEDTDIEEAKTENMRTEIYTLSGEDIVAEPLIYSDTIIEYTPKSYDFVTNISSPTPIKNWKLSLLQDYSHLKKLAENNKPENKLKYNLEENIRQIAKIGKPIEYSYKVNNFDNLICESNGTIPVHVTVSDSLLHISGMLLFSFDSYESNQANIKVLDYIRQFLRDGSQVSIIGYTDKSGFPHFNQHLSKNRALAAASLLFSQELAEDEGFEINNYGTPYVIKRRIINFNDVDKNNVNATLLVLGVGKQEPFLSDNSIPEGRFYSRAVTIDVKVPIIK
jgi:outer membrane protein OmpA-like peptidoglycan-associated protein